MKAADISDQEILDLIQLGQTSLYTLQTYFHATCQIPPKVTLAKVRQMIFKGRLLGCPCGCRGDYAIPATPEEGQAVKARRLAAKRELNQGQRWPMNWREQLYTAKSAPTN